MDQCPNCEKYIPSGLKECPECGYKFSAMHIFLDRYGGMIPELFSFVYEKTGGDKHKFLSNTLAAIVTLGFVIITILAFLIPLAAISLLITGDLGKVSMIERVSYIVAELVMFGRVYPLLSAFLQERRNEKDKENFKK